jgi:hypothetical protein
VITLLPAIIAAVIKMVNHHADVVILPKIEELKGTGTTPP